MPTVSTAVLAATAATAVLAAHVSAPALRGRLPRLPRLTALRRRGEGGQASAEYALVLLGVAAVALLVGAWAARTDGIGRLFDAVMDKLVGLAG